jgi:hypothetical protein
MTCCTCDLEKMLDGVVPYTLDTSWNHKNIRHSTSTFYMAIYETRHPTIDNLINHVRFAREARIKYSKLPAKDVDQEPWHGICIDLAGPWKTTINNKIKVFHALMIIDLVWKLFRYTAKRKNTFET